MHIDKAIDVVDTQKYCADTTEKLKSQDMDCNNNEKMHAEKQILVSCKYFECYKYEVQEMAKIMVDASSFVSIIIISGKGVVSVGTDEKSFVAGESFFVTAGHKTIEISGSCEAIVTRV